MRIRGENENCIGITRDEAKPSCAQISKRNSSSVSFQAETPDSYKSSITAEVEQSLIYTDLLYSDRNKIIFLPDSASLLAGIFTTRKKLYQHSRQSGYRSYRITQRNVFF